MARNSLSGSRIERRRTDQSELWADDVEASSAAPAAIPSQPPPRPAATRPQPPAVAPQPVEPEVEPDLDEDEALEDDVAAPAMQAPPVYYAADADEPYYDDYNYDYEEEPSLFGNPYVLAALAVFGAILLAVVVVVFFGQGGGDAGPGGSTGVNVQPTGGGGDNNGSAAGFTGLQARSIARSAVREGPGLDYLELGLLQADQDVDVVGRNDDGTWFLIVFPPQSQLRGWVPETALNLPDDVLERVAVVEATPIPRPSVEQPTLVPTQSPPTEAPGGEPDIAVAIVSECLPGRDLEVLLSNTGNVDFSEEPVQVLVTSDGVGLYNETVGATLAPGSSASFSTGVAVQPPSMTVTVVLPQRQDVEASNNVSTCSVGGGNQQQFGPNVPPPINGNDDDDEDEDDD